MPEFDNEIKRNLRNRLVGLIFLLTILTACGNGKTGQIPEIFATGFPESTPISAPASQTENPSVILTVNKLKNEGLATNLNFSPETNQRILHSVAAIIFDPSSENTPREQFSGTIFDVVGHPDLSAIITTFHEDSLPNEPIRLIQAGENDPKLKPIDVITYSVDPVSKVAVIIFKRKTLPLGMNGRGFLTVGSKVNIANLKLYSAGFPNGTIEQNPEDSSVQAYLIGNEVPVKPVGVNANITFGSSGQPVFTVNTLGQPIFVGVVEGIRPDTNEILVLRIRNPESLISSAMETLSTP